MFKKPLFWIVVIIVIAIFWFLLSQPKHKSINRNQTSTLNLQQTSNLPVVLPKKHTMQHYVIEKNLSQAATTTPQKENAVLNLDGNSQNKVDNSNVYPPK